MCQAASDHFLKYVAVGLGQIGVNSIIISGSRITAIDCSGVPGQAFPGGFAFFV